jgi:fermentation-respiration switch protein FrsA (DUF1100 family)
MYQLFFKILIFFAMLAAGFIALVRYLESNGVFFPSTHMAAEPSILGLPCDDVYFKTRDNQLLNGWFFKNPHAKSTLIFAHGNAGNMSDRMMKIRFFYDLGLNVFIFDYRGYGKSQGRPTEAGVYLDAQAAYDYLTSRADVDINKIILYGCSLGGAVMIDLATHRKAALLIVESSFSNAADMAQIHYPFVPAFFLSLKFNSLEKVKHLGLPKLFVHSPEDEVVPYWIGQKLYVAAADPKEFIKIHGGHHDGSMSVEPEAAAEFINLLKNNGLI